MDTEKVFGGSPLGVIVRLVIISLIVGVVMKALGLQPLELVQTVKNLTVSLFNWGFDALDWVLELIVLGAVIVVPVWIVFRVIKSLGGDKGAKS